MTETARIHWEAGSEAGLSAWLGLVGQPPLFAYVINRPVFRGEPYTLVSQLPRPEGQYLDGDPDELKATAERWLEGYVSRLGAIFPDEPARPSGAWHADWRLVSRDAEGNMILKYVPADALYCVLPVEEC